MKRHDMSGYTDYGSVFGRIHRSTVTTYLPKIIRLVINLCQNHEHILLSWHANLNDTIQFS